MPVLKLNNIKQRNTAEILRCFCENGSLSRREVASRLGCDHATVTRAVKHLMAEGFLIPAEKKESSRGRPREMITLHPESPLMLGIELTPRMICAVVISLHGEIIDRCNCAIAPEGKVADFRSALCRCVETLTAGNRSIAGCGMATIGTIAPNSSIITECANFPELNGIDPVLLWQENFTLPLPHITDRMLAEMYWFTARNPELRQGSLLVVDAGEGIGMALAHNGKLPDPRKKHGGELGHNTVIPDGEICRCGRKGCLEAYASSGILLEKSGCASLAEMLNDPQAAAMLKRAAGLFALVLANQLNNLMPDHAVITGELITAGSSVIRQIEEILQQQLFPSVKEYLHLQFLSGSADAAAGAALLAREEFLNRMVFNTSE